MWQAGDKLGRFRLDREIGQGSHGVVFQATDTALDTPVAVKILHPWLTQDSAVRDRFKRELLLARRVTHPGVCRLFDLHEEGEAFFITMDYVEGQTLLNILKNEGRLQPLRGTRILRGVCQALAAAHNAGVIHRDLKPANIIVRDGDNPMILDFGTATAGDVSRVTRPGTAVGSMRFIAPEVFTGISPSVRTDLYSLGVVAYVTFAGKLPYNAASGALEMLEMIRNQPPQRLDVLQPEIPARLADVVARAMEKNPDLRFASALAFDEALAEVERAAEAAGPPPAASSGNFSSWAATAIIRDAVVHNAPTVLNAPSSSGDGTPAGSASQSQEGPPTGAPTEGPSAEPSGSHTVVDQRTDALSFSDPAAPRTFDAPVTDPGADRAGAEVLPTAIVDPPPGTSASDEARLEETQVASEVPPPPSIFGEATVRVSRFAVHEVPRSAPRDTGTNKLAWVGAGALGLTGLLTAILMFGGGNADVEVATPDASGAASDQPDAGAGSVPLSNGGAPGGAPGGAMVPADAGTDAGVVAATDAGAVAQAMDFGAGEGEGESPQGTPSPPPDTPQKATEPPDDVNDQGVASSATKKTVAPKQQRPPRADRFEETVKGVRDAMARKGFIAGDLPTVEELLARARRGKDAGLAEEALASVERQRIDRPFVLDKLKRFNARYDKSKQPDVADKVDPLAREAASHFAAGRFEQANESLNRAFSLLRRTK